MNNTKCKTQFKGILMLSLAALIWGTSFVAQSLGMENIEAFTFNGIRTLMGSAVLLPVVLIRNGFAKKAMNPSELAKHKKTIVKTLKYGAILGVLLCFASNFQQFAFNYSTSGKIAFITALYMFFVPIFGLVIKKKVPVLTWVSVAFGFLGLYFLCMDPNSSTSFNKGDLLTVICAVFFAIHILFIERFSPEVDGVALSCMQFFVSGSLSLIMMFIFENPQISNIKAAVFPLLYSGVMSCGFAYTFQIIGQKYTESALASLILCLESVFGVLAGAVILKEVLTEREILGCVIMFIAIIVSEVADVITAKIKAIIKAKA